MPEDAKARLRRQLGNRQRELLVSFRVGSLLLTPNGVSRTLVARGLLREDKPGGSCCITPAGLRALADAMEAGQVQDAITTFAAKREENVAREARLDA